MQSLVAISRRFHISRERLVLHKLRNPFLDVHGGKKKICTKNKPGVKDDLRRRMRILRLRERSNAFAVETGSLLVRIGTRCWRSAFRQPARSPSIRTRSVVPPVRSRVTDSEHMTTRSRVCSGRVENERSASTTVLHTERGTFHANETRRISEGCVACTGDYRGEVIRQATLRRTEHDDRSSDDFEAFRLSALRRPRRRRILGATGDSDLLSRGARRSDWNAVSLEKKTGSSRYDLNATPSKLSRRTSADRRRGSCPHELFAVVGARTL